MSLAIMHWLASHYHSEFLATPQLVRFDHAEGTSGHEPTLLIKGNTLLLKYIVQGVPLRLCFARIGTYLLYAVRISDDEKPATLWSVLEHKEEKAALLSLAKGNSCNIFLFNELAVNVAWVSRALESCKELEDILEDVATGRTDHESFEADASAILDRFCNEESVSPELILMELPNAENWNAISNQFVTAQEGASPIDLFDRNEGGQQEQLAVWLTDSLHSSGAHLSPQIPKGKGSRELTDVLLSHQFGAILIESKTLTIFGREKLPGRKKLARDVASHIKKAIAQLKGGIRQIKRGARVTNISGSEIDVEREKPPHGIVMIPDLDLIDDHNPYGIEMIREFMEVSGGFIHILDVSELFRIVQAAEIISSRSDNMTPIMAFDYYLMERARMAHEAGTLCIEVLLRISES